MMTEQLLWENIRRGEPVLWENPRAGDANGSRFTAAEVEEAEARLRRFAPLIAQLFPETAPAGGIIESPLTPIPAMSAALFPVAAPFLLLKQDDSLPVSGSVKARGGIYAVLKHAETLLTEAGLLRKEDDYTLIAQSPARDYLRNKKLAVGSTGNLGLSIGIMGAALGFQTSVYISREARAWKKALLRAKGVRVVESEEDYAAAVAQGRRESDADPDSYFIDDERSEDLYLGYATAAARLARQLREQGVTVSEERPLYVYLPCGVGGGPGGITLGLKQIYGNAVRCYFVEPTQAPCMLVALASGRGAEVCAADYGLSGVTAADGLAVTRASALVYEEMRGMLDGCLTVRDETLFPYLKLLDRTQHIRVEPSACAGFEGFHMLAPRTQPASAHIVWSTGGGMVPLEEMAQYLA